MRLTAAPAKWGLPSAHQLTGCSAVPSSEHREAAPLPTSWSALHQVLAGWAVSECSRLQWTVPGGECWTESHPSSVPALRLTQVSRIYTKTRNAAARTSRLHNVRHASFPTWFCVALSSCLWLLWYRLPITYWAPYHPDVSADGFCNQPCSSHNRSEEGCSASCVARLSLQPHFSLPALLCCLWFFSKWTWLPLVLTDKQLLCVTCQMEMCPAM